jgi:putative ABC transport system permease protein
VNGGFALRMALREGRAGVRRIGVFMLAVALGVAALVGLRSFQADAEAAARVEARQLLGGDLRVQSQSPFPEALRAALDSLSGAGHTVGRGISLGTVVSTPGGTGRLVQLNALEPSFPLAGELVEEPAGAWARAARGEGVVAGSETLLGELGVALGDTLRIGSRRLPVLGVARGLPLDPGFQTLAGPPLFAAFEEVETAGLLGFGSLAQYRAFVVLADDARIQETVRALRRAADSRSVSIRTARQEAESIAAGFRFLSGFLGLVGLAALLLGGIGVASAVHVYVRERIASVAVLRCLGARQNPVFVSYLLQAGALGLGGSLLGALLGVGAQFLMPVALAGALPFELAPRLRPGPILAGIGTGVWVSTAFALLPLLRVREIPPLAALRLEVGQDAAGGRVARASIVLLLFGTAFALAALQLGGAVQGAILATGLAVVLLLLAGVAALLVKLLRGALPAGAPFALRQGLAGLHRPGNQTLPVLVALGFGTFLMGSLAVVETNLRARVSLDLDGGPAVVLFDIQDDQVATVTAHLREAGVMTDPIPIVPARLQSVGGTPVSELMREWSEDRRWMLRRLYRNTERAELDDRTERLVAGSWWNAREEGTPGTTDTGAVRISLEEDLAGELGVGVGDEIVWDLQGVELRSVVASLRAVEWGAFQPNFFVVFEPGALEGAPASWVALAPVRDPAARDLLREQVARDAPNVSFLDVSALRDTIERIASRLVLLFRSLAVFLLVGGFLVLLAALLTTRYMRRSEGAILRTLGASGWTVRGASLTEYALLGAVAAGAGLILGAGGGTLLLAWRFDGAGAVPWGGLGTIWLGVVVLTVLAGWLVTGPVLKMAPMRVLREGEAGGG